MKIFRIKHISALILTVAAVGCGSTSSPTLRDSYAIDARVSSNGVLLGEPSLLVEPGTTAMVSVEGARGYQLALNVRPAAADRDQALVEAELTTRDEELNSTLVVDLGEPATISVDDVDLVLLVRPATQGSRTRINSSNSSASSSRL